MKKTSKQNITTASNNSITVPTATTTATHSVTTITATVATPCIYICVWICLWYYHYYMCIIACDAHVYLCVEYVAT